ncbi:MAG: T9SS type A sorting domain-containing protein, partial [Bacteroidota bacterium]
VVTVNPILIVGSISDSQTTCTGTVPGQLNGVAPGNGTSPTYQWQVSQNNSTFSDITGASNRNYQPGILTANTYFRQLQNAAGVCGGPLPTNVVMITINPLPGIAGNISGPATVQQGETGVSYSVPVITGATGYAWTLPVGASIASGFNTNSIKVNFSATALSGIMKVTGTNNCGNGVSSPQLNITVTPLIPTQLNLTNIVIPSGQNKCYNALQTITVAGNGTNFTINSGGSVTMIAGQNIRFLSGAIVHSGGYLYGHITTNGSYCGTQGPYIVNTSPDVLENITEVEQDAAFFKIYPNPTTGKFILELPKEEVNSEVVVQIYSILGKLILKEEKPSGNRKYEFMISDRQPGIYVISVTNGGRTGTAKIIKK